MDDRMIIPVEVEHQQTALELERDLDLQFRQRWELVEDYPACPVGLALLRGFAEAYPELFDFFVVRNPSGHQAVPAVLRNPLWIAYERHWSTCDDCMEA